MKPLKPTNLPENNSMGELRDARDVFEQSIQSKLYDFETIAPAFDFEKLNVDFPAVQTTLGPAAPQLTVLKRTKTSLSEPKSISKVSWVWMARAASVVMVLGLGGWASFNALQGDIPTLASLAKVSSSHGVDMTPAINENHSGGEAATSDPEEGSLASNEAKTLVINGFTSSENQVASISAGSSKSTLNIRHNELESTTTPTQVAHPRVTAPNSDSINAATVLEDADGAEPQIIRLAAGFSRDDDAKMKSARELRRETQQNVGQAQAALVANGGAEIDLRNPFNTSARLVKEILTQRGVVKTEQYGNRKAVTVRIGGNVVRVAR